MLVISIPALQVFRAFRQVSEEQRKISEGRYRSVLLEAVQDAIYLSAQNQQLQAENKELRKGQCFPAASHITEKTLHSVLMFF